MAFVGAQEFGPREGVFGYPVKGDEARSAEHWRERRMESMQWAGDTDVQTDERFPNKLALVYSAGSCMHSVA